MHLSFCKEELVWAVNFERNWDLLLKQGIYRSYIMIKPVLGHTQTLYSHTRQHMQYIQGMHRLLFTKSVQSAEIAFTRQDCVCALFWAPKCSLTTDPGVPKSNPSSATFLEIDREVTSVVILPLLLNHEGQLSFGKSMSTKYWLTKTKPRKSMRRLTGHLNMTSTVLTGPWNYKSKSNVHCA